MITGKARPGLWWSIARVLNQPKHIRMKYITHFLILRAHMQSQPQNMASLMPAHSHTWKQPQYISCEGKV